MQHVWDERAGDVQDGQNELPAVRAARKLTQELLAGFEPAIDVGCGTGTGALELGPATIGVDRSATMARTARSRG